MCPFPGLFNSPLNYSYYIQLSQHLLHQLRKPFFSHLWPNFWKQLPGSTAATAYECQKCVYCLDTSLLQPSEFCKVWNCPERLICGYRCLIAGRDVEHEFAKLFAEVDLQCAAFLCCVNLQKTKVGQVTVLRLQRWTDRSEANLKQQWVVNILNKNYSSHHCRQHKITLHSSLST